MSYYIATRLEIPFEEALTRTREALGKSGFGIISEIDIAGTLRQKIGADFHPYRILGACNPRLAHEALKIEDKVGTMLPCNVVVQEPEPGVVEIAAVDPVASMMGIDNDLLKRTAEQVRAMLADVIDSLGATAVQD